jgi:hypothetical protein
VIPSDDDTPVSDDAFSCKDVGAANAGIVVVGGDVVGVVPGVGDCVTSFFEHPDNVTIFEIRRVVITRVLKRTRSVDFAGITVAPQTVATPFPSVFTVEMRFGFGFFFDDEVGK